MKLEIFKRGVKAMENVAVDRDVNRREYVQVRRLSGGQTGGWYGATEEDVHRPVEAEGDQPFTYLYRILEKFSPHITFLQYKRLEKDIVETFDETDNEYYGNYFNYEVKRIYLDKLFAWLKKEKLL
jgi:hypothetical protein